MGCVKVDQDWSDELDVSNEAKVGKGHPAKSQADGEKGIKVSMRQDNARAALDFEDPLDDTAMDIDVDNGD